MEMAEVKQEVNPKTPSDETTIETIKSIILKIN